MQAKISIVTPTLNAGATIKAAILSVLYQDYPEFEHIIVDGGSSDATLKICARYPHLRVVPDNGKGQSDAMNLGFQLATGEIFGCLNADDIYLPNAFDRAAAALGRGASFAVGSVLYLQEDGRCLLNNPRTTLPGMLRHWEANAFCINPVGYFYRREVHEAIGGFNVDNHYSMDLEFLLAAAAKHQLERIDPVQPLGVFYSFGASKTAVTDRSNSSLWTRSNFAFIDQYVSNLRPLDQRKFRIARWIGYNSRRCGQSFAELSARKTLAASATERTTLSGLMAIRWLRCKALRLLERVSMRLFASH